MPEISGGSKFPAKLLDMNKNVVHTWTVGGFPPKMLPGGSVIGCSSVVGTYDCAVMKQESWDGVEEWSFAQWTGSSGIAAAPRQHHDFQRDANPVGFFAPGQDFVDRGKTLILGHTVVTVPAIRATQLLDDVIYEVDWDGNSTGFEWHGADHIADFGFDAGALTNIRNRTSATPLEWLHGNSVSRLGANHWYDEGNTTVFHPDNIIFSSRDANFVLIISAQTGEVVWRIGPDFAGRPEAKLEQFAGQHHAHMIPKGLPGAGNILVFDNGGASGYGGTAATGLNRYSHPHSRVLEFNPVTFDKVWEYGAATGEQNFYSQLISSAQRLPNGNTLITIGQKGRIIEVTPSKKIVWEYQYTAGATGATASLYRAYRIPPEWLPAGQNAALGNYATWSSLFE